jgi:hypothetical protein
MADDEVTLVKSLPITPTDPFIMNVSFDVAVKANNDHPTSTSYMWETSITVTYQVPTACTAPTTVGMSDSYPLPSTDGTLSWSGAAPGTVNAITGYDVYRATSEFGSYSYLKSVTTTNTYGSTTVTSPDTLGQSYYYKVLTKGNKGSLYYSGLSSAVAFQTAITYDCLPPTAISFSSRVVSRPPLMSWGGAYPGYENPITGFEIEYSESADNVTWGAWTALKTVYTTASSGSTLVEISATLGNYRRYQIKTLGTNPGYDSDWSNPSESVRTSSSNVSQTDNPLLVTYEYPHVVFDDPDYVEKGPYPLGLIQLYNTLIWHPKYQGVGYFALNMPFNETDNALLVPGNCMGKAGNSELMLILFKRISKDKNGVETVEVKGVSLAALLAMRVITYSEQNTDYPVGQIKSLLRNQQIFCEHYDGGWVDDINADLMDDSYGDRRFPDFHWREPAFSYTESDDVVYQPEKLYNMLDEVLAMCIIEGCGIRVSSEYYTAVADTLTNWLELYKGTNRSISQDTNPHVIFDEKLGNVRSIVYTHSIENVKTAGYTTNLDIDELSASTLRLVDIMSDNAYSAGDQAYINDGTETANVNGGSGMNRDELGIVVSEIVAPDTGTDEQKLNILYNSCRQAGRNEINKATAEHTLEVEINPTVGRQYNSDYFLGDIVTSRCDRYGVTMDARIAEAEEIYQAGNNPEFTLIFGDTAITLLGRVKQITRRRG